MKIYAKNTEDTLITFHTGRGGRFYNPGHVSYCDQDIPIDNYTDDLFVQFENEIEISNKIGDRENLKDLFYKALEDKGDALYRIEQLTGLHFGKEIYTDGSGNYVGLDFENDGTGIINIDNEYNTTVVMRLSECSLSELKLIYHSSNYKSSDVEDYCKEALIEAGEIENEVETI